MHGATKAAAIAALATHQLCYHERNIGALSDAVYMTAMIARHKIIFA